ncbi:diguanylate cyclase [Ferrimonas senticii]|uniref:sensor domain-containing diguanylate cyclase n=1 Tax=Ferrimonas senticii TaxID=394566 RepID=UPI0012EB8DF3|nr:diguanylate cyclase [Ferrimonas senticii]
MNLRNKLLIILIAVALASHLLITVSYFYYAQQRVTELSLDHLEAIANIKQQRLANFIANNKEKLSLIASRTQLRKSLQHYQQQQDTDSFLLIKRILNDALQATESIAEIFITDSNGDLLFATSDRFNGNNFKHHPLFLQGQQMPSASLLLSQQPQQSPALVFSAPLLQQEQLLGVVAMQVKTAGFQQMFTDHSGLGRSGEVLAATYTDNDAILLFSPLRFAATPLLIATTSVSAEPMRMALQQQQRMFERALDYRQVEVVAVSRYLGELQLGIVVKMDRSEVLATNNVLKGLFLALTAVIVVATIVLSLWLANKLTQPILRVANAARRIANGKLDTAIQVNSNDELSTLAMALNAMAENLIASKRQLEQKVLEKTAELRRANVKLQRLTHTDALTDLNNRRYFDQHLNAEWSRCSRTGVALILLMIDIDHFKQVNDNLGHHNGDRYLRIIAAVLREVFQRNHDVVARYGGEEFAVILTNTSINQAQQLAERFRHKVEQLKLKYGDGSNRVVTASIGVGRCQPQSHQQPISLVQRADQALYRAKRQGRNRSIIDMAATTTADSDSV